jgi:hypothetical protein
VTPNNLEIAKANLRPPSLENVPKPKPKGSFFGLFGR